MAVRIKASWDKRELSRVLGDGQWLVGSSAECDVVIAHPTVSRRHLTLLVRGDLVDVEDLNSSNGSALDGRALGARATWLSGQELRIGEIRLSRESAAVADSEIALGLPEGARPASSESSQTLSPIAVDRFTREALPSLLDAVAQRLALPKLAALLGQSAIALLPLSALEIGADDGSDPHTLWFGTPRTPDPARSHVARAYGIRLSAEVAGPVAPSDLDGLFAVMHALLRLAPDAVVATPRAVVPEPVMPDPAPVDPDVRRIYRRAARIAGSQVHVLIRGESGTGKEVLARYIQQVRARPAEPFVALNCAALPEDLLDAELFGIERGVATGVDARAGRFELAHGGTLFLDEIGDMTAATQARILRVLQEGEVTRIGGSRTRPARVRVISATNKSLDDMVARGEFRLDLIHRISDWEVELPPLRSRPDDIPLLAAYFLSRACEARGVHPRGFTRASIDALLAYEWPGNIRELEREMQRIAVFLEDGDAVSSDLLRSRLRSGSGPVDERLETQLAQAERAIIKRMIAKCEGRLSVAAERLGIARSTLYRRLTALGLQAEPPDGD